MVACLRAPDSDRAVGYSTSRNLPLQLIPHPAPRSGGQVGMAQRAVSSSLRLDNYEAATTRWPGLARHVSLSLSQALVVWGCISVLHAVCRGAHISDPVPVSCVSIFYSECNVNSLGLRRQARRLVLLAVKDKKGLLLMDVAGACRLAEVDVEEEDGLLILHISEQVDRCSSLWRTRRDFCSCTSQTGAGGRGGRGRTSLRSLSSDRRSSSTRSDFWSRISAGGVAWRADPGQLAVKYKRLLLRLVYGGAHLNVCNSVSFLKDHITFLVLFVCYYL